MSNDILSHGDEQIDDVEEVAVIGLAGRFPGAGSIDEFWENLCNGVDALHEFSNEELDEMGIPASVYERDNFVRRGTILPDMDKFDAGFFGLTPREAAMTDPQARIFLETSYTALEHAGYNPFQTPVPVGVFAGSNPNDYASLLGVSDPTDSLTAFDQLIATDKDFLATRVSHRLNLKGPAINVQTACSTSLVTIHLAARSLLDYQCGMALAGGVSVNLRQGVGYFAQQGMILSPDGVCRAFDSDANGTTLGQAVGVVVLKRLSDAIADNDTIYAVIKGSALNNDGSAKISYTAPSEDGQAEVIAMAHGLADVSADDITYVETHGTGTKLGDPIEIAGLRRAFRAGTDRVGYCAIGSVKTSVGHTDAAAGVTSFIKTVLSLHHKKIPASLNFTKPNPALEIETSPFYVNTRLQDWDTGGRPRIAGVSSFGIGGTNAHVVLSEAPAVIPTQAAGGKQLLVLSARSTQALGQMAAKLADHLDSDPPESLADIAHTLQTGRGVFDHRMCVVADSVSGAALRGGAKTGVLKGVASSQPDLVFTFTGQGAQYPGMARDVYKHFDVFRACFDQCASLFETQIGIDLKSVVLADTSDSEMAERLRQTSLTQPALFSVEYAMARQLISWGLAPTALLGHSIGEYAAICLAGVLSLEDAITAVAARGRLMQSMQSGSMLAVHGRSELPADLPAQINLAALNSPELTVVAGSNEAVDRMEADLSGRGVRTSRLRTSHAFHSFMMEPMQAEYLGILQELSFQPPRIPVVSNVTGTWITDEQAVDPEFWASQIRLPVLFSDCLSAINARINGPTTYIEVGPGRTLTGFVRDCSEGINDQVAVNSLRPANDDRQDDRALLECVGRAWISGVSVNWDDLSGKNHRRVELPSYAFERVRYWAPETQHLLAASPGTMTGATAPLYWSGCRWRIGYTCHHGGGLRPGAISTARSYLILGQPGPAVDELLGALSGQGLAVQLSAATTPAEVADLFESLSLLGSAPDVVVHAHCAQSSERANTPQSLDGALETGLESVLEVARQISKISNGKFVRLEIVTNGVHQVMGDENIRPEVATLLGPAKVVPIEYEQIGCRLIDLDGVLEKHHVDSLCQELMSVQLDEPTVALRSGHRWAGDFSALPIAAEHLHESRLVSGGHYLIVGGLGGVGLSIAQYLAQHYQAHLALTSRSGRPAAGDDADAELLQRLELLDRIEASASSLTVAGLDATDLVEMGKLVERIEQSHGPLNGVIVAAGVADMAGAIHHRTRDSNRASISAKVDAISVLDQLFAERKLDFMMFSSSIATALYHNRYAQVGYVTGNSYAEAFGLVTLASGTPIISIAWDDWLSLGMSVRAAQRFSETYGDEIKLMDEVHSFTPAEGVKLFELALASKQGLVYVSTTDLRARVRDDVNAESPFLLQARSSDDTDISDQAGKSQLETIVHVWESLLGLEGIDPDDDFFALGGDSLQVARMVDRLNRLLKIDVPLNLVFDNSTAAALDHAMTQMQSSGGERHEQGEVTGPVALSPGQIRFLGRGAENPNHFNVSVVVRPESPLPPPVILKAVQALYVHHDALRLRLKPGKEGWSQHCEPAEWDTRIFSEHDLSDLDAERAQSRFSEIAASIQSSLSLADGPLFRVALVDMGQMGQRLLMVAHHLTTDRLSLLMLIDHLDILCQAGKNGETPALPSKTSSFKAWSDRLSELAASDELAQDIELWRSQNWQALKPLPFDLSSAASENKNASGMSLKFTIDGECARQIMSSGTARVDEILLLALARAVAEWSKGDAALIDVLNHGRRILGSPIDISRTVGFFLTYSTTLVDFSDEQTLSPFEQIRRFAERGWTLDVLRERALAELPKAKILFNFVGRAIESQSDANWTVTEDVDRGPETDPSGLRDHPLAVYVETGEDSISVRFVYSTRMHRAETVQALADAFTREAVQMVELA